MNPKAHFSAVLILSYAFFWSEPGLIVQPGVSKNPPALESAADLAVSLQNPTRDFMEYCISKGQV